MEQQSRQSRQSRQPGCNYDQAAGRAAAAHTQQGHKHTGERKQEELPWQTMAKHNEEGEQEEERKKERNNKINSDKFYFISYFSKQ